MALDREKQLYELKAKAIADARSIVDAAEKSGASVLEGESEVAYQRAAEDIVKYDNALTEERKLTDAEKLVVESRERYADAAPEEKQEIDTFYRDLWGAIQPEGDMGAFKRWLPAPSGIIPSGKVKDTKGNDVQMYRMEKRAEVPYLTAGTTTGSNVLIPAIVSNQIEELAWKYSAVLQCNPNVFATEGINTLTIPKVTTVAAAVETAENTEDAAGAYAVTGVTTLAGYRQSAYSNVTEEMLANSGPDMMPFIQSQLVGAVANKIAHDLIIGAGTGHPTGLQVAAAVGVTAASSTTFTADEVIDTYGALSAEYWTGLQCVMSQAAYLIACKLKDDNGDYLLLPDVRGGLPNSVLGVPVHVDAQGLSMAATHSVVTFFQPSHFHVRYGMGGRLFMDVSTDYKFTLWNRYIRCARWLDCNMGIAAAASSLRTKT